MKIQSRQIGVITLDKELIIDQVTDIFIRINSQGAKLNQAYTLYLLLSKDQNFDAKTVDRFVQKWYVLSTLTSRYITSPESKIPKSTTFCPLLVTCIIYSLRSI